MPKETEGVAAVLVAAFKWHTGLLAVLLVVGMLLLMVWRRRGARHHARMVNDGRTPAFDRALGLGTRALYFCMGVALLQEAAALAWQFGKTFGGR